VVVDVLGFDFRKKKKRRGDWIKMRRRGEEFVAPFILKKVLYISVWWK